MDGYRHSLHPFCLGCAVCDDYAALSRRTAAGSLLDHHCSSLRLCLPAYAAGRYTCAIGGNLAPPAFPGLNVRRVSIQNSTPSLEHWRVLAVSDLDCPIERGYSQRPATNLSLNAIAACVIGGTAWPLAWEAFGGTHRGPGMASVDNGLSM